MNLAKNVDGILDRGGAEVDMAGDMFTFFQNPIPDQVVTHAKEVFP